jgi:hypothetical protein
MSLADVDLVRVTAETIHETHAALRNAGDEGYELFVLWTGILTASTLTIQHCWVPTQESYKLGDGLCVRVGAEELHRLNRWLYDEQQVLGVQIHAHPTDAFHSETDDNFPVVTTLGGFSIVVPNFCRTGLGDEETVIYRLEADGWDQLDRYDVGRLFPDLKSK